VGGDSPGTGLWPPPMTVPTMMTTTTTTSSSTTGHLHRRCGADDATGASAAESAVGRPPLLLQLLLRWRPRPWGSLGSIS